MPRPANRGTYALVLWLPENRRIRIGALGTVDFPRGWYVYIGSALNGLHARVARHLRQEKKRFWHIDYFLDYTRIVEVWLDSTGRRLECAWARKLIRLPNARVIAPRMGASDCDCATHLVHLKGR